MSLLGRYFFGIIFFILPSYQAYSQNEQTDSDEISVNTEAIFNGIDPEVETENVDLRLSTDLERRNPNFNIAEITFISTAVVSCAVGVALLITFAVKEYNFHNSESPLLQDMESNYRYMWADFGLNLASVIQMAVAVILMEKH